MVSGASSSTSTASGSRIRSESDEREHADAGISPADKARCARSPNCRDTCPAVRRGSRRAYPHHQNRSGAATSRMSAMTRRSSSASVRVAASMNSSSGIPISTTERLSASENPHDDENKIGQSEPEIGEQRQPTGGTSCRLKARQARNNLFINICSLIGELSLDAYCTRNRGKSCATVMEQVWRRFCARSAAPSGRSATSRR